MRGGRYRCERRAVVAGCAAVLPAVATTDVTTWSPTFRSPDLISAKVSSLSPTVTGTCDQLAGTLDPDHALLALCLALAAWPRPPA